MKKIIILVLALLMLLSLAACGSGEKAPDATPGQNNSESAETNDTSKGTKEGSVEDIKAENVVKLVTDEIDLPEDSMYRKDYASPSYHAIYDFSDSEEIKDYYCIYVTDPNKYEDTNRIMADTNCHPVWGNGNTTVTATRGFGGMTMNVQDILDRLQKNKNSFTAYLKDGSAIHVQY